MFRQNYSRVASQTNSEESNKIVPESSRCEWALVEKNGALLFHLGNSSVILIGSEGCCDINIQAAGVEKRHAILCFDPKSVSFSVKDLKSNHGTYLNEQRLQSEHPKRLNNLDLLRFGYDSKVYQIRSGSANPDHSRSLGGNLFSPLPESPMDTPDSSDDLTPTQRVQQGLRDKPPSMNNTRSRVSSPSYGLDRDSGHGSSSVPSSPAKEMSPAPNSLFSSRVSPVPRTPYLSATTSNSAESSHVSNSYRHSKDHQAFANSNPLSVGTSIRRDSLEDQNGVCQSERGSARNRTESELLRLEADINVPNEVFALPDRALPESFGTETKPRSFGEGGMIRSRSLSGDGGGGGRSRTELSSLYGTPHWWPDELDVSAEKRHNLSYYNNNTARRRWSSDCANRSEDDGGDRMTPDKESSVNGDSDSVGSKKFSPMAFTVDFGGTEANKGFGITDSISKFAPRHRRNLSLTKVEDIAGRGRDAPAPEASDDSPSFGYSRLGKKYSAGVVKGGQKVSVPSASDRPSTIIKENEIVKDKVPYRKTLSDKHAMMSNPKPSASVVPTTQNARKKGLSSGSKKNVCDKDAPSRASKEVGNRLTSDAEDGKSETGTYTIDDSTEEVIEARENIDNVFGANSTALKKGRTTETVDDNLDVNCTAELEWVREWAESASKLQQHPQKCCEEDEVYMHNLHRKPNSGAISAQAQSRTRPGALAREASVLSDSGYALGYASDSSNEGMDFKRAAKYNRALAIKSRLLGYDSDGCTDMKNRQTVTPVRGVSPRPNTSIESRPPLPTSSSQFSRNDGGRFSLRASNKSRSSPVNQMPTLPTRVSAGPSGSRLSQPSKLSGNNNLSTVTPSKPQLGLRKQPMQDVAPVGRKPGAGAAGGIGGRSNSTLTAKEVELANWKRRKNYDPMKAAAQAKKKDPHLVTADNYSEPESVREELVQRQATPNSPVASKSPYFHRSSFNTTANSYEDMPSMVDEIESSHSNSPIHCGMSRSMHEDNGYCGMAHSPSSNMRSKNKLEALDNLVIATIHSLSSKVRTSARKLLEKLQAQHSDDENGELVKEMVSQLRDMETLNSTSSPTKSPSRDLSGTLKNLKKLEQVILVLDRVICDDDGDM